MNYFEHSVNAVNDPKVTELIIECGPGAYGAYWCILEQIYRDETPLVLFANQGGNRTLTKVVSHWLCIDTETLETWVSAMLRIGLLETDPGNPDAVTSRRAAENIAAYREKCETARRNGKKGGRKTDGKAGANRVGTKEATERQANKTKQNKGFGFDKQNQKPCASGDAAAARAAPPATSSTAPSDFKCPTCGSPLSFGNGDGGFGWYCPNCGKVDGPGGGT